VALLFGCGDESAEGPASGTATIGPAGGVLSSTDGKVELTFPEGAVAGDVTVIITLEEQDVSGVNPITPVYRFEPAGTTFAVPVKVRFRYEEDARGAAAAQALAVYWTDPDGSFERLASGVDEAARLVSAEVSHFSFGFAGTPDGLCCETEDGHVQVDGETCPDGDAVDPARCEPTCCELSAGADLMPLGDCDAQAGTALEESLCDEVCCFDGEAFAFIRRISCDKAGGWEQEAALCSLVCCDAEGAVMTLGECRDRQGDGASTHLVEECDLVCCDDGEIVYPAIAWECSELLGGVSVDSGFCGTICCAAGGEYVATSQAECEESGGELSPDSGNCDLVCCANSFGGYGESTAGACLDAGDAALPLEDCEEVCCSSEDEFVMVESIACLEEQDWRPAADDSLCFLCGRTRPNDLGGRPRTRSQTVGH